MKMSHKSTNDRLVYMANQIAKFFAHEPAAQAAQSVENHIRRFWEPKMRHAIIAYLEAGGQGLNETAFDAINLLREHAQPA